VYEQGCKHIADRHAIGGNLNPSWTP